jgi:hypothetical protein
MAFNYSFGQTKEIKAIYDSLSTKYKVEVVGFTKTYFKNRETLIIFWYDKNGSIKENLLWTKEDGNTILTMPYSEVKRKPIKKTKKH